MKLSVLCGAAGIEYPPSAANREVGGVVTDSRVSTADSLFVCIKGLHTDGHTYIEDAMQRGCRLILTERGYPPDGGSEILYLQADDTKEAAARLYHAWYGSPCRDLKMIGVTGTNGKTSVSHMLVAILEAAGHPCGLIGTLGCRSVNREKISDNQNGLANMTTPDPQELYACLARMRKDGAEYAVMEASSHALALGKLAPIDFELAIFTNLTPEHLDFHQSMEAYAKAKATLFAKSKVALINRDSPYFGQIERAAVGCVIGCSQRGIDDFYADRIHLEKNNVSYELHALGSALQIDCPIAGEFNVMNSMQAAAAALILGIPEEAVCYALSRFAGVKGRMESVLGEGGEIDVLIDYAHTPDAMERLLRTVRQTHKGKRLTVVFGCGGERDRTKRAQMGEIASTLADRVILTSDNSRGEDPIQIIEEILKGVLPGDSCRVVPDRREAIREAILTASIGECVVLAGKGHEEYEIGRSGRLAFCEKSIATAAYAERKKRNNE